MRSSAAAALSGKGILVAKRAVQPLITRLYRRPQFSSRPPGTQTMANLAQKDFFLDEFAQKQFNDSDANYSGTRIHFDTANFVAQIQQHHDKGAQLVDGYAPFCKHIFVPNFVGAKLGALAITESNRKLLQSGYSSRRPEELPVLSRF